MTENIESLNDEKVVSALENATNSLGVYEGSQVRTLVFKEFSDANYYYRKKAVLATTQAVKIAEECGDEIAEVKAFDKMYQLLVGNLDTAEKVKFFQDCYLPITQVLKSDEAKGLQYYLMGHRGAELNIPEVPSFFKAAVACDNENVLQEDVFRCNPELVFHWLECFAGCVGKETRAVEYEKLLNNLVKNTADVGAYYYRMACLCKDKQLPQADYYYRECIKLGYKDVVEDPIFCKVDYEREFMEWFNNDPECQRDIEFGIKKCFKNLWASATPTVFESSKKWCAQTSLQASFVEGCKRYSCFADEGFDWAELWILENVAEDRVQQAISDRLIQKWFAVNGDNRQVDLALGRLFIAGRGDFLKNEQKYFLCISKFYLEEGEYTASLASFLQMFDREGLNPCDFTSHESGLRHAVSCNCVTMIQKDLREANLWCKIPKKIDESLVCFDFNTKDRPQDYDSLKTYFESGILPDMLFRRDSLPCCTRYFLLKQIARIVGSADVSGLSDVDASILKAQYAQFKTQSEIELEDAIVSKDMMSLFVWIIEKIAASDIEEQKMGVNVICCLLDLVNLDKMDIPYLLLYNYCLKNKDIPRTTFVTLCWILKDSQKNEFWNENHSSEEMCRKIFDIF